VSHLPDVLRPLEVPETVSAQVEQGRVGRESIGDQLRSCRRHQDLVAVPLSRILAARLSVGPPK